MTSPQGRVPINGRTTLAQRRSGTVCRARRTRAEQDVGRHQGDRSGRQVRAMRKAFARSGVVVTAIGALLLGLASPANAYQTPYVSNLGPEILTYIRVLDI